MDFQFIKILAYLKKSNIQDFLTNHNLILNDNKTKKNIIQDRPK